MKTRAPWFATIVGLAACSHMAFSYPPGVGILSKSKSCMSCHVNNGP